MKTSTSIITEAAIGNIPLHGEIVASDDYLISSWAVVPKALSDEECDRITEKHRNDLHQATVGPGTLHTGARDMNVVAVFRDREEALFKRMDALLDAVNNHCFRFHLFDKAESYDLVQLGRYGVGGHYTEHNDCYLARRSNPNRERKISWTIQLSEPDTYTGGDLRFPTVGASPDVGVIRERGTAVFFPSFLSHRVLPVGDGERFSLVGWAYGYPWR